MKKTDFWKNFSLGTELDIAGRFIYNGLQCFHQMQSFHYEEEIFEFFYNVSVGLERALKIAVILIEHDETVDQKEFEGSLITHNHIELLQRVIEKHDLPLARPHNEFLHILAKFYKTHRYGRYDFEALTAEGEEKKALHKFLEKHLNIKIEEEEIFQVTKNDDRIRRFMGKLIGKVSVALYSVIEEEASRLNIYTYEIRYGSKASKIFQFEENTFSNEDILWKELLIFFMNTKETSGLIDFLKEIEPLEFDPELAGEYLECFAGDIQKLNVMDELEHLYQEEVKDVNDRLGMLSILGDSSATYFWDDE